MATALDDLNSLLTPEDQAKFAELLKNPKFAEKTGMMTQFFKDYAEFAPETETPTTPATSATPAATTTPANPARVTPKTASSATADLDSIGTLIDQKLATLKDNFLSKEDATKARTEITTNSLMLMANLQDIRDDHREEFGERLNTQAFEEFVTKATTKYPNLRMAHDAFVNEKRIEVRVKKGVEEAVKQKTSSATVPAQTTSAALSPAQEIIRKAKASENGGGETNLSRAAGRLKALMEKREGTEAA